MRFIFILFFLFYYQLLSSQNDADFSLHKQFYIKGDATIIGNNILGKYKKKSFNKLYVINDKVKMKYIDIDDDKNTFSSSEATLNLPEKTKKIVSATLYWSAIYSYKHGVKRKKEDNIVFRAKGKRDSTFHRIKFKTPNGFYQNIEGTIIKDKFKQHINNAPYVCYADVTDIVNKNLNPNGAYTVANIKAEQGYTSGGSAAGWLLYVVYETDTSKPKYISTYHGLVTIQKKPLDIILRNFKTVSEGTSKVSLTLSALEGDRNLGRDQCLIYNTKKETFVPLESKLRTSKNFFNSSITRNNKYVKKRLPDSNNTLGFDIVEMDLPNKNNELISNGTTSITLRFKTKSDRFHLFFTAFKTELEDVFFDNKKAELSSNIPLTNNKIEEEITVRKNINVAGLQPGYYVISNVFSETNFAIKWERFLKGKSHKPKTFINSENQWYYISIYNSLEEDMAKLNLKELQKNKYFKGLWIQKVNL